MARPPDPIDRLDDTPSTIVPDQKRDHEIPLDDRPQINEDNNQDSGDSDEDSG